MSPSFSDKTDLSLLKSVFVRFLSVTKGCLGFDRSFFDGVFFGTILVPIWLALFRPDKYRRKPVSANEWARARIAREIDGAIFFDCPVLFIVI